MIGVVGGIGWDIIDGVLTCIFVNDNEVCGGNDDGSAGNSVDYDGNINLGIGLGMREGIGLGWVLGNLWCHDGVIVFGHGLFTIGCDDFRKPFHNLFHIEKQCMEEYFKRVSDLSVG